MISLRSFARMLSGLALLTACASTSPRRTVDEVSRTVESRSGHRVRWNADAEEDRKAAKAIDELLNWPLTADAAVQVALLGNPSLQATLEGLAISQAELVQAGLLKNPSFTIGRTAWESEHISPNLYGSAELDFLDVLTMPLRKRVAATEHEATKLAVGDRVLELAHEVRTAFFEAQAAEQLLAMWRLVDEAAQTSAGLARRQHEAGNMSDLALETELGLAAETSVDWKRAERDAAVSREHLNKLMGTWGPRTAWTVTERLPEMPAQEADLEHLEATAIRQRLDIGAGRRSVQAMDYALGLAKTTRWFGTVNVGVEVGRLRENRKISFGPSVTFEIPLFDQRQAQIAKLEAYKRQAERELQALAVDVRADVRAARARVLTTRAVVENYGRVVVPSRERAVRLSQQHYDAMLLGVYQLIQAKQNEYEAYREWIESLRDYWIARSELDRAIGGRIERGPSSRTVAAPPETPSRPATHVH